MKTQHIRTILTNVRKRLRPKKTTPDTADFGKKSWIEQVHRSTEGKREQVRGRLAADVISRIIGTPENPASIVRFPRISEKRVIDGVDDLGASPEIFIYDCLDKNHQRIRKRVSMKDLNDLLETARTSSRKSTVTGIDREPEIPHDGG